jgi:uncharacterized membrane protein SpoIIM required for sporulation
MMILDVEKFIARERPLWKELEDLLDALSKSDSCLTMDEAKRFYYLYERVSEDLTKVSTFSGERELRKYLEMLVSKAYSNIYSQKKKRVRFNPVKIITVFFPAAFRRNIKQFNLACAVTLFGFIFGGMAVAFDNGAKKAIFPAAFQHLQQAPDERVKQEEQENAGSRMEGRQSSFAAQLMTHNIRVSCTCLALGVTWGIGTILLLFYNGVMLGGVALDFILGGQTTFMLGWLLPHGVIEIPAIVIAGQAGLLLGSCLLKPGKARRKALREKRNDIIMLIAGVAFLLIWAGAVESFISQLHAPIIPYAVKIIFGIIELAALWAYLAFAGKKKTGERADNEN